MAFLKRRGYKFHVDLELLHLSDVPLVNAVLFAKVRLLNGGAFEGTTERVEVHNHSANWNSHFNFCCRIAVDPSTGVLEKCMCRISLRKEQKGGKTYQKLGFVDINLAQFAASGTEGMTRSYLLDGYGINQRQDNSRILIKVTMSHQSTDPVFKVPRTESSTEEQILNPVNRKAPPGSDDMLQKAQVDAESANSSSAEDISHFHDEAATLASTLQAGPSYEHFRKEGMLKNYSSNGLKNSDVMRRNVGSTLAHTRRLSQDRAVSNVSECVPDVATRMRATRVDAEDLIDRILAETGISDLNGAEEKPGDRGGLALFVSKDGEAVVAANTLMSTDSFERVHIADAGSPLSTT